MSDGTNEEQRDPAEGSAGTPARRRGPRRAVRRGTEREDVPGLSGDERGGHDDNDERLLRDVPPHWGRR